MQQLLSTADKDAQGIVNWLQAGEMKVAETGRKATNAVITFLFWVIKKGGDEQQQQWKVKDPTHITDALIQKTLLIDLLNEAMS